MAKRGGKKAKPKTNITSNSRPDSPILPPASVTVPQQTQPPTSPKIPKSESVPYVPVSALLDEPSNEPNVNVQDKVTSKATAKLTPKEIISSNKSSSSTTSSAPSFQKIFASYIQTHYLRDFKSSLSPAELRAVERDVYDCIDAFCCEPDSPYWASNAPDIDIDTVLVAKIATKLQIKLTGHEHQGVCTYMELKELAALSLKQERHRRRANKNTVGDGGPWDKEFNMAPQGVVGASAFQHALEVFQGCGRAELDPVFEVYYKEYFGWCATWAPHFTKRAVW